MIPSTDCGDIISERRFAIPEKCTVETLCKLTIKESVVLFQENIENILNNNYQPMKQNQVRIELARRFYKKSDVMQLKNWTLVGHWKRLIDM